MAQGISIDEFADEIANALYEDAERIDKTMQKKIDQTAKKVLEFLLTNPNIPVRSGGYKNSFRKMVLKKGEGYKVVVIYSKKGQYQKTHLLEHGHQLPGGGRSRAFPHWRDAEKLAEAMYTELSEEL